MTSRIDDPMAARSGTRVLIVEADAAQASTLARSLARRRPDLTIVTSGNGLDAVRLVSDCAVDLILTDLALPGLDGFELLSWAAHHCPEVPVFAMSAASNDQTRVSALGAAGYFPKPIEVNAVVARLTAELSQSVRGHVQNVSLASFLQLMEMERKTCTLTVKCAERVGSLVLRRGELISAETAELRGESAAIAIVAWPNPGITIERHLTTDFRSIDKSLSYIIMEAMRVQDEAARETSVSEWPAAQRGSRSSSLPLRNLGSEPGAAIANVMRALPSGVRAIAVVETSTGSILQGAASDRSSATEAAAVSASLLKQQMIAYESYAPGQELEEILLFSATGCQVIRPLGAGAPRFGLVAFELDGCNLVVARLELTRFVFSCGRAGDGRAGDR